MCTLIQKAIPHVYLLSTGLPYTKFPEEPKNHFKAIIPKPSFYQLPATTLYMNSDLKSYFMLISRLCKFNEDSTIKYFIIIGHIWTCLHQLHVLPPQGSCPYEILQSQKVKNLLNIFKY